MKNTPVLDGWHSGQVVRKHTMMNIRAENVAEHTWGAVHILLSVFTNVSVKLITALVYHDFGERATGDIPGPVKWANPAISTAVETLEEKYIQDTLSEKALLKLEDIYERDKYIIEFCDRIEFCFSMYREHMLGNKYSKKPFYRSLEKALAAWQNLKAIDTIADHDIYVWWPEMEEIKAQM